MTKPLTIKQRQARNERLVFAIIRKRQRENGAWRPLLAPMTIINAVRRLEAKGRVRWSHFLMGYITGSNEVLCPNRPGEHRWVRVGAKNNRRSSWLECHACGAKKRAPR